jgi:hypothetical protein
MVCRRLCSQQAILGAAVQHIGHERESPMQLDAKFVQAVNLNHPGRYVHWGVIQISLANIVVIAVMIAIFAAAILLPFPGRRRK